MSDKSGGVESQLLKGAVLVSMVCLNLCCSRPTETEIKCKKSFPRSKPTENVETYRKGYLKSKQKMRVLSTCGHMIWEEEAIIHGKLAPPLWWPWQVYIQSDNTSCGATLISRQWLLTAAHCTIFNNLVLAGTHNLHNPFKDPAAQIREVAGSYVHEGYNHQVVRNDIMLIKVNKPFRITEHVSPICLPNNTTDFSKASECYVSGWGRDQVGNAHIPDDLKYIQVQLMDTQVCALEWVGIPVSVNERNICLKQFEDPTAGPCQGDSGGPLSCSINGVFYVGGTASFVSGTRLLGACTGMPPDVYTRTASFIDWIYRTIDDHS